MRETLRDARAVAGPGVLAASCGAMPSVGYDGVGYASRAGNSCAFR